MFNQINTTCVTSGAGTAYNSGAPELTPGFQWVRVTRSLVLYVCFVDSCLSFRLFSFVPLCCLFFFDIRILITSLWYLQTLLNLLNTNKTKTLRSRAAQKCDGFGIYIDHLLSLFFQLTLQKQRELFPSLGVRHLSSVNY